MTPHLRVLISLLALGCATRSYAALTSGTECGDSFRSDTSTGDRIRLNLLSEGLGIEGRTIDINFKPFSDGKKRPPLMGIKVTKVTVTEHKDHGVTSTTTEIDIDDHGKHGVLGPGDIRQFDNVWVGVSPGKGAMEYDESTDGWREYPLDVAFHLPKDSSGRMDVALEECTGHVVSLLLFPPLGRSRTGARSQAITGIFRRASGYYDTDPVFQLEVNNQVVKVPKDWVRRWKVAP